MPGSFHSEERKQLLYAMLLTERLAAPVGFRSCSVRLAVHVACALQYALRNTIVALWPVAYSP